MRLERIAVDAPDVDRRGLPDGRWSSRGSSRLRRRSGLAPSRRPTPPPTWTLSVAEAKIANGTLSLDDASIDPAFRAVLTERDAFGDRAVHRRGAPGEGRAGVRLRRRALRRHGRSRRAPTRRRKGHFALVRGSASRGSTPYYARRSRSTCGAARSALAGDFDVAAGATPLQFEARRRRGDAHRLELARPRRARPALAHSGARHVSGIAFDLAQRRVDDRQRRGTAGDDARRPRGGWLDQLRAAGAHRRREPAPRRRRPRPVPTPTWALRSSESLFDRAPPTSRTRASSRRSSCASPSVRVSGPKLRATRAARRRRWTCARASATAAGWRSPARSARIRSARDWRVDAVRPRPRCRSSRTSRSRTNILVTGGALATKGRLVFDTAAPGGARATLRRRRHHQRLRLARPADEAGARPLEDADADRRGHGDGAGAGSRSARSRSTISTRGSSSTRTRRSTCSSSLRRAPPRSSPTSTSPSAAKPPAVATPARRAATHRVAGARTLLSAAAAMPPCRSAASRSRAAMSTSRDFFVQPELFGATSPTSPGSVSALSATQAGDVDVDGAVEHIAPVEVRGKVNPFAQELSLDLTRQGARRRPAAAYALLREVRGLRHREGQAVVRRPLPGRGPQARRRQQARARPAHVRRSASTARRRRSCRSCSPSRCSRTATASSTSICRSQGSLDDPRVLDRRPHRPRHRQPDHQGRHGAVRAARRARRRRRRAARVRRVRAGSRADLAAGGDASSRRWRRRSPIGRRSSSTSTGRAIPDADREG